MRLAFVMIFAASLTVSAHSVSQTVTISGKNLSLENIFSAIEKQTGYVAFYNLDIMAGTKPVTVHVTNMPLSEFLAVVLKEQPLLFHLEANTIFLSEKKQRLAAASTPRPPVSIHVTDGKGQPLEGATIKRKKDKRLIATDATGTAQLDLTAGDVIEVSFVGYKTQELTVRDNGTIKVVMLPDVAGIEQVVVVGYGSTKKKDLTGSVSLIEAKDVRDVPFVTIDNALAGKAAGVAITKTDGSPGGAVRIRIRGSSSLLGGNEPLYVIDGVPVQVQSSFQNPGYGVASPIGNDVNNPLQTNGGTNAGLSTSFVNGLNALGGLNVNDIESITILKDASSTAIYGSKAANGVVIITTKMGKKDMVPQISVGYSSTVSKALTPDLLNANQFRTLFTEAVRNSAQAIINRGNTVSSPVMKAVLNNPGSFFGTANTDWVDAVTRTPVSSNAELSIQGGSASTKYFTSISYNTTPGVLKGTDLQRVSGKINVESEIKNRFRIATNLILGYTDQNLSNGVYAQALKARPDLSIYDSSGNYTSFVLPGATKSVFTNPLAMLQSLNNAKSFSLIGSLAGTYEISRHLQFKSTVSLSMMNYNQRIYTPSFVTIGGLNTSVTGGDGIGNNSNRRSADWFLENVLSYNRSWNDHTLDLVGGQSYQTSKTSFFAVTATGYPNDNILNNLSSAIQPIYVQGDDPSRPQSYLLSFYARANYGYKDRYLFTFTGRSDGSSKFGEKNKFGYFPSGAVAWKASNENFMKKISWISELKLRGSYGLTGNQNIGDQMFRTLYAPASYAGQNALTPVQLGNEGIGWESTRQLDAGIDLSLWNERVVATVDYYRKQTSGALLSLPVAPSSSFSSLLTNAVSLQNKGLEVALSVDIIRTKDFKWSTSANITWNRSVVTKLQSDANLSQIGDLTGLEVGNTALIEGRSLGLLTGTIVKGIIKTKEDLAAYRARLGRYADQNFPYLSIGDPIYQLNNENSTTGSLINYNNIIASAAPEYFGGFTQRFSYRQFDLQFNFTYSQGGKLIWGDHISSIQFQNVTNLNTSALNRYTPDNSNTNQPQLTFSTSNYRKSNLDVFSSSYVKLRTLSLNYRMPIKGWMKTAGIQGCYVFASGMNLFTITPYPGLDPEVSNDPYSVAGGYFDVSNYPAVRSYTIGVRTTF